MPLSNTQQYIDIALSLVMMGAGLGLIGTAIYLIVRKR